MDNVRLEGVGFAELSRALKAADKELRKSLFTEARQIAQPIVNDMKASVLALDSTGKSVNARRAATQLGRSKKVTEKKVRRALGSSGLRESIARAVHVKIADKGWKVGVRVRVDGTKLPADQKYLPRGLDSVKGWRHPIHGTDQWAQQYGNPPGWFTSTAKAHRPMAERRMRALIADYVKTLAARIDRAA